MTPAEAAAADSRALDAQDPLGTFAAEFHHPHDAAGRRLIYLCGHSLGLQPVAAAQYLEQELENWRRRGVLGHHDGARPWISYHEHAAAPLADLTGSAPGEVVAMNSLTVNLHLLMVSFFRPAGRRTRVLMEKSAFPSDRYAITSQLKFHGLDPAVHLLEVEPRAGERHLRTADLIDSIERHAPTLALVLLPGVQYLTGQCLEMSELLRAAQRAGAVTGLDLAHAIGNVPLSLHDWDADFAVWCSYKYLNAGPGAIGGAFVHARHAARTDLPRFAGWWGHDKSTRFLMGPDFSPLPGAEGWQISNPPVLASAPLLASLQLFERAGMHRLRAKSLRLTGYCAALLAARLSDRIEIITPLDAQQRGSQLSLRIRQDPTSARRSFEALTAAGVIADWREPDVLRITPIPLYTSYTDVHRAIETLVHVLAA